MIANYVTERLVLTAPKHLVWMTEELPAPGPHEVLIQTHATAISIGSELPIYRGNARAVRPPHYPRSMGYESVGLVVACGSAMQQVQPGNRVVAFYGQRTLALVPENRVIVVPDGISDAIALLSILTCDAAKGVRKIAPKPEEAALITGAGAIGLLTLFILRAYGVAQVDMIEPREERHAIARLLGAHHIWQPHSIEGNIAYAIGFECSSHNEALTLLQQRMKRHGRICILADGNIEPLTLTPDFHEKELFLVGSSDGWDYHQHAAWYFQEVLRHPTHLEHLFELHIPREELIATYEQLAHGATNPIKVLFSYSSDCNL